MTAFKTCSKYLYDTIQPNITIIVVFGIGYLVQFIIFKFFSTTNISLCDPEGGPEDLHANLLKLIRVGKLG